MFLDKLCVASAGLLYEREAPFPEFGAELIALDKWRTVSRNAALDVIRDRLTRKGGRSVPQFCQALRMTLPIG